MERRVVINVNFLLTFSGFCYEYSSSTIKLTHYWLQIIAAPVPIPIIPSVNTCMSFTTTTMTTTTVPVPIVNANQLQALAEVCSTVQTNESLIQSTSVSIMNSLASETKVLPLCSVKNGKPALQEPMDCNTTPGGSPAHTGSLPPDVSMSDSVIY